LLAGDHGFEPTLPNMGAIFIASGPSFRRDPAYRPVEGWEYGPDVMQNVDVYPLLCRALNVNPAPNNGSVAELSRYMVSHGSS